MLEIMCKNFCGAKFSRFCLICKIFQQLTVTIWMSTWRVPSIQSTTRYQESQVSLTVVVDRAFTLGGVDLHMDTHSQMIAAQVFFSNVTFLQLVLTAKLFQQRNFPDLWYVIFLPEHCLDPLIFSPVSGYSFISFRGEGKAV